MPKTTRGTVYRSAAADRHQTRRYLSGIGTGAWLLVGAFVASLLLFPGWLG